MMNNLTIAEEKVNANQKQAIIETPKFNEYYSLLGKHQSKQNGKLEKAKTSGRSKSLVKSQIIFHDPNDVRTANQNQIDDTKIDTHQNKNHLEIKRIIENGEPQERFVKQCHSSCSQNDKSLETLQSKRIKVIKLKKSEIKFSKGFSKE